MAKRGVIILAIGEKQGSTIYGNLAFNLALSLKSNCDVDITLLYSDKSISELRSFHLAYFDKFIKVPKECFTQGSKLQYQKAKTYLYWLSPYDETIYIDADALWMPYYIPKDAKWRNNDERYYIYQYTRDIDALFDSLKGKHYTAAVGGLLDIKTGTGKMGYTHWRANTKQTMDTIIPYYNLTEGLLPQYQTTFQYFEKTDKAERVFKKALEIYEDDDKPCNRWADGFPDEFCFNVASCIEGLQPDISFMPVFVEFIHGKIINQKSLYERYSIFTNCGAKVSGNVKLHYNNLAKRYCDLNNIPYTFYHVDKRNVLTERLHG